MEEGEGERERDDAPRGEADEDDAVEWDVRHSLLPPVSGWSAHGCSTPAKTA